MQIQSTVSIRLSNVSPRKCKLNGLIQNRHADFSVKTWSINCSADKEKDAKYAQAVIHRVKINMILYISEHYSWGGVVASKL